MVFEGTLKHMHKKWYNVMTDVCKHPRSVQVALVTASNMYNETQDGSLFFPYALMQFIHIFIEIFIL